MLSSQIMSRASTVSFSGARNERGASFVAWSARLCGVLGVRLRANLPRASTASLSLRAPILLGAFLFNFTGWAADVPVKESILVFLGDSLTEGYGVAREKAFPALVEAKIREAGLPWKVVNSGVSGSTSASANSRLDWVLKSKPDVIFLALGANDGLRGFKPVDTRKNLQTAIQKIQGAGVKVILAGMMMPPNYGEQYRGDFQKIFPDLAKQYKLDFVPFILEGVGGDKSLNLADGIHPNEKGHALVAATIWKKLEPILRQTRKSP